MSNSPKHTSALVNQAKAAALGLAGSLISVDTTMTDTISDVASNVNKTVDIVDGVITNTSNSLFFSYISSLFSFVVVVIMIIAVFVIIYSLLQATGIIKKSSEQYKVFCYDDNKKVEMLEEKPIDKPVEKLEHNPVEVKLETKPEDVKKTETLDAELNDLRSMLFMQPMLNSLIPPGAIIVTPDMLEMPSEETTPDVTPDVATDVIIEIPMTSVTTVVKPKRKSSARGPYKPRKVKMNPDELSTIVEDTEFCSDAECSQPHEQNEDTTSVKSNRSNISIRSTLE